MKISNQQLTELIGQRDENHPSSDELAGLLDQNLPEDRREQLLAHLERCSECSQAVAVAMHNGASADSAAPEALPAAPPGQGYFSRAMAASVAVVAVALASLLLLRPQPPGDVLRTADPTLEPASGATVGAADTRFDWPVPTDLSLRRVRLMDETAQTLWLSEMVQPPLRLPDPQQIPGKTYVWQLEDANGKVVAGPQWFRLE